MICFLQIVLFLRKIPPHCPIQFLAGFEGCVCALAFEFHVCIALVYIHLNFSLVGRGVGRFEVGEDLFEDESIALESEPTLAVGVDFAVCANFLSFFLL